MSGKNLHTGIWSNQFTRSIVFASLMIVVLMVLSVGLLVVSTPCVDTKGCFKQHCQLKWFNRQYITMIEKAHSDGMNLKNCKCHKDIDSNC